MTRKHLPRRAVERCGGESRIDRGVLDIGVSEPILHKGQISASTRHCLWMPSLMQHHTSCPRGDSSPKAFAQVPVYLRIRAAYVDPFSTKYTIKDALEEEDERPLIQYTYVQCNRHSSAREKMPAAPLVFHFLALRSSQIPAK
jgi:hypothetical protein